MLWSDNLQEKREVTSWKEMTLHTALESAEVVMGVRGSFSLKVSKWEFLFK